MKKENAFLKIFLALFSLSPYLHSSSAYGQKSLRALPGVELFVHCTGDAEIKRMEKEIMEKLKSRLESMNVPKVVYNAPDGDVGKISSGGALKLLLTGFKKKEGDYFVYASLQLHQRAYLATSHEYMDCQTWDMWKMGIYTKNEILSEVEYMLREFANDFISANSF
ncbi:MAG: hypothetical protein LBC85_07400 [Fibromonadaceae bacterium]|jgi:hypothetical protein|nr:hypothetical protein [Fibromonadaceae bacterium]